MHGNFAFIITTDIKNRASSVNYQPCPERHLQFLDQDQVPVRGGGGGGGGGTLIDSYMHRLGHFFWGGGSTF